MEYSFKDAATREFHTERSGIFYVPKLSISSLHGLPKFDSGWRGGEGYRIWVIGREKVFDGDGRGEKSMTNRLGGGRVHADTEIGFRDVPPRNRRIRRRPAYCPRYRTNGAGGLVVIFGRAG